MTGTTASVRRQTAGTVTILTVDHPPVNAFSVAVWTALSALLTDIAGDDGVHAVVLTGAGTRAFSAGADVKESATLGADAEAARRTLVSTGLRQLADLPVPVVCAVNGPAIGGGLNIAALCDIRIAADTALFSLPEINHERLGGGGAFVRRLGVPAGVINQMLYTGRRLTAREAYDVHLIDEVVPPDRLRSRALEVAGGIAARPRAALVGMKRAIQAAAAQTDWRSGYLAAESTAHPPEEAS